MTAPLHGAPTRLARVSSPSTGVGGTAVVAASVAVVAGVAAAAEFGGTDVGPELCPVRNLSGGWCPGCGGARAARHLLHGEPAAAWSDHPWVVLAALQVVVALALAATIGVVHRRRVRATPSWWRRAAVGVVAANVALLVVVWGVRVVGGSIPSPI